MCSLSVSVCLCLSDSVCVSVCLAVCLSRRAWMTTYVGSVKGVLPWTRGIAPDN